MPGCVSLRAWKHAHPTPPSVLSHCTGCHCGAQVSWHMDPFCGTLPFCLLEAVPPVSVSLVSWLRHLWSVRCHIGLGGHVATGLLCEYQELAAGALRLSGSSCLAYLSSWATWPLQAAGSDVAGAGGQTGAVCAGPPGPSPCLGGAEVKAAGHQEGRSPPRPELTSQRGTADVGAGSWVAPWGRAKDGTASWHLCDPLLPSP